ncbi:hypothetical protein ABID23_000491 [Bartonella silvatica]|uniref:Uncharacterized protein n=1 Tax=Bartonella silvatica TaxID=357760 RepID=A0ABV2HFV9_9HYPH
MVYSHLTFISMIVSVKVLSSIPTRNVEAWKPAVLIA